MNLKQWLLNMVILKVIDFNGMMQIQEAEMKEAMDLLTEEMEVVSMHKSNKHEKYGQDQIERFIRVNQEESLTVSKAAALCGISRSTAYELINEFNASNGTVLPRNKPRYFSLARITFIFLNQYLVALFSLENQNVL